MRSFGMRHSAASRLNSDHSAKRSSLGRTKSIGGLLQSATNGKHAVIAVDCSEQRADSSRIGDGGVVCAPCRGNGIDQGRADVVLGDSQADGVAEHLSDQAQDAVSGFVLSHVFNAMNALEQMSQFQIGDGCSTDEWE